LGWGFKTVSKGSDRTNLYVFLTPRVIKNPLELEKIYKEKKNAIKTIKKGEILLYNKEKFEKPAQDSNNLEPILQ